MKIRKEDYPIIASLKLSGSTWAEIAALYGVTSGHLRNRKDDIMKDTTEGDKFKRSSFAKTVAMHIALKTDDNDTKLRAVKTLIDNSTDDKAATTTTTRSRHSIVEEIMSELKQ